MRLFPRRTNEDDRVETRGAGIAAGIFAAAAVCSGVAFFLLDHIAVQAAAVLLAAVTTWLALQAMLETALVARVGPERFVSLVAFLGVAGAFLIWWR